MAIFQMFEMEIYLQLQRPTKHRKAFQDIKKTRKFMQEDIAIFLLQMVLKKKNAKMNAKNALVCPRDFHCDFLVVGRKSRPPIRKPSHRDLLLSSLRKCGLSDVV